MNSAYGPVARRGYTEAEAGAGTICNAAAPRSAAAPAAPKAAAAPSRAYSTPNSTFASSAIAPCTAS